MEVAKEIVNSTVLPTNCRVAITLIGDVCTGSVDIVGDPEGEQLRFTEASTMYSENNYDEISKFVLRGLTSESPKPHIKVMTVDDYLQPETWSTEHKYKCTFTQIGGSSAMWMCSQLGLTNKELYYIRTHANIQAGDEFYCNGLPGILLTTASSINAIRLPNSNILSGCEFYATRKT